MAHESRFRKPEFKEKLARARTYERRIGNAWWPRYFVLALCLAAIYFLAVSKTFLAVEASVNENGPSAEDVKNSLISLESQRLWYLIPRNHILILDKASLLPELRKSLPEVRSIKTLKKSWP